jgi:hypothetical protein
MTINIKDGGFSGRQSMNRSKAREETRLQAAGCEATPEPSQLQGKIIPFPGITLAALDDEFQTQLDGFLREMGYIE